MQPSSFLQVVSDLKSLTAVLKGARLLLLLSVPPALRQIKEHEDARTESHLWISLRTKLGPFLWLCDPNGRKRHMQGLCYAFQISVNNTGVTTHGVRHIVCSFKNPVDSLEEGLCTYRVLCVETGPVHHQQLDHLESVYSHSIVHGCVSVLQPRRKTHISAENKLNTCFYHLSRSSSFGLCNYGSLVSGHECLTY